jgi:uncharacterized membrane protein
MSLNTWSLVLFLSHIFFYLGMVFAVSTKSSVGKLALLISSWMTYQIITLWYGIATKQIGFILMFIFQLVITVATVVISTERSTNENK